MIADVVVSAERAGIGQSRGGDHAVERDAFFQFGGQRGLEFREGSLLHEADEWLHVSELQRLVAGVRGDGLACQAKFDGERGTDGSGENAFADVAEKFAAWLQSIHGGLRWDCRPA